jgi:arylsulfatase A-like enzyme
MQAATKWLLEDSQHHRASGERFMLFVDEFDPHEPFDTPEEWAMRYDDTWEGPHMIWPPYAVNAQADGVITKREAHQIRAQYGSKLSMIDHWLGKVLDALDTTNAWADTAVILCTDHGHYLGDVDEQGRDVWGKPSVPVHKPLGHIPLLISWPGAAPTSIDALTTSTDIHATLADVFGATINHRTHGSSLVPLISGAAKSVRDWLLTGVWGREVQLVTEQWRYTRGPVGANTPLSMWSNRWSTMPISKYPNLRLPVPDERAFLDKMPGSTIPVIRQPFREGDLLPFWAMGKDFEHLLFDRREDLAEHSNRVDGKTEHDATELLRVALNSVDAPQDQLVRLGLN